MTTRIAVRELAVESLAFAYGGAWEGRIAVDGVSFRMGAGELVAVVGPNGCGKSTLLRLIVGELKSRQGKVLLDGTDAATWGRAGLAQRIALVPQLAAAPFGYAVREMVLMGRYAMHEGRGFMPAIGFETAQDLQLADQAMWAADVHHLVERPVNELSGGERQRVAIARAFTQDTSVLLLDEPTSSLDLFHQLELLEQLRRATGEERRMALLVTHDLNLAAAHATRVLVMNDGKIVADGPPREVLVPAVLEPVYRVKITADPTGTLHFSRMPAGI